MSTLQIANEHDPLHQPPDLLRPLRISMPSLLLGGYSFYLPIYSTYLPTYPANHLSVRSILKSPRIWVSTNPPAGVILAGAGADFEDNDIFINLTYGIVLPSQVMKLIMVAI